MLKLNHLDWKIYISLVRKNRVFSDIRLMSPEKLKLIIIDDEAENMKTCQSVLI